MERLIVQSSSPADQLSKEVAPQPIILAPANWPFLHCYNLCLCLQQNNKQVLSKWKALTTLPAEHRFCQSANNPTQVWSIKVLWSPNLCTTTHQLQVVGQSHPAFGFLGSTIPPALLSQQLGPWLHTTQQGLWPWQLSLVEQTICLGWLLFWAPEYNLGEHRTILTTTRVRVASCYWRICNNLLEQVVHQPSNVKEIHIKIDKTTPQNQKESILGLVFSPKTKAFLAGINMRLAAKKISTCTNSKACLKAKQWQALQAHFLVISDTWSICVTPHLDYNKHHMIGNTLAVLVAHLPASSIRMSLVLCC